MIKKRMIRLSCLLVISLCVSVVVLLNWLQATTRCQMPFLPFVPSSMPITITGFLADVEGIREWNRSIPHWWKPFNDFPLANRGSSNSVTEIAVRGDDIWAIYNHNPSIERYNLGTGSHTVYHTIGGREIRYTQHLLISRNGEVWVTANLGKSFALARFDRTADTFKAVEGNDIYSTLEDQYASNWGSSLVETLDGNLLIPFQKNIYLYDPTQKVTQSLLPDDFGFSIKSMAESGNSLWFVVAETNDVWNLNLATKTATNYGHPPIEADGAVAVDGLSRVWLGYFARLEGKENGEYHWWYPKTYPIEFIALDNPNLDNLLGELDYHWSTVWNILIASDGSIWFSGSSGIVKYDPHQNTWCLSEPEDTNFIAEDEDGNLWMVPIRPYSQTLYKYQLRP